MTSNQALFDRAGRVLVGGVNSPVRSFRSVGGTPYFVERGEGAYVYDAEGKRYIDYVQSYGASILGHAHPKVVEAIQTAAARGTTFGAPTLIEVELAETITSRVPGCDMIRMTSSGTEATMSAIRLARGITGRAKVVKFAGCYHGTADSLLAEGGSGVANQSLPGTAGVPQSAVSDTLVVPFNAVEGIGDDVAAVIVEPVAANMNLVPPNSGFLQGLRAACDRAGALLIFDEVITGFRLGNGGATVWSGVQPDLWCFAKVIGGGLPVGAFGGRADLMRNLAPLGPVYQGGTLSGNPLACTAGLTVLRELSDDVFVALTATAAALAAGFRAAFAAAGVPAQVPVVGPLIGLLIGATATVTNFDEAKAANAGGHYATFFHEMLRRGVALAPGAYEVLFPSLAHTAADVDATIEAAHAAATVVAAAHPSPSSSPSA